MKKRRLVPPTKRRPRITGGKCGAPFGSRNAFKHGKYTRECRALDADIRAYVCMCRALIDELNLPKRRSRWAVQRASQPSTPRLRASACKTVVIPGRDC